MTRKENAETIDENIRREQVVLLSSDLVTSRRGIDYFRRSSTNKR